MRSRRTDRGRNRERGIALLISIFILLLISVVGIALIVSSGTESALAGNYRASTSVYNAALAGLEEVRGRLSPKNPNAFTTTDPTFLPPTPAVGTPYYVLNPAVGEVVAPWDPLSLYPDKQFAVEFPGYAMPSPAPNASSVWNNNPLNTLPFPGPLYKWVRINAVSEQSMNLDVDADAAADSTTPLYYDVNNRVFSNTPAAGPQVLELTALAVLPNGSQKLLQYIVAPIPLNLTFPAALTLDGNSDFYSGPSIHNFQILGGNDAGDSACGGPTTPYPVPAIGVPDNTPDVGYVVNGNPPTSSGIPPAQQGHYTGVGPTPSVLQVALAPNLQTVQSLDQLVRVIVQNADAVIVGPATQTNLPSGMSPTNPMTIVIQGDPTIPSQGNLTMTGAFTGYGLLLVTGNFQYTPDLNWNGIVLVIGQGNVSTINGGGGGLFSGAMLIAQTRNASGNLLAGPSPGPATFTDISTVNVGQGIYYNCSWIVAAQPSSGYKILSFHEIQQQ